LSKTVFFRKRVVTPSLNALALLVRLQERHPSCKNLRKLSQKFLFWRTRPNIKQLQKARLNMCLCEWWRLQLIRGSAAALFTSDLLNFCAEAYSRSVSITVRLTTMHYAVMWFDTVSCILAYVFYFTLDVGISPTWLKDQLIMPCSLPQRRCSPGNWRSMIQLWLPTLCLTIACYLQKHSLRHRCIGLRALIWSVCLHQYYVILGTVLALNNICASHVLEIY